MYFIQNSNLNNFWSFNQWMINIFIRTCSPSSKYIFSEKNDHNKLENLCLYNLYIVQLSLWYMLFDNVLGILKKMLCMSYLKNWKLDLAAKGRRTCCPIRCCLEYQKLTLALSKFVKLTIFIYKYFAKVSDKTKYREQYIIKFLIKYLYI